MKFIAVLLLNCFLILGNILYFVDHPFTGASVAGKIKQVVLGALSVYILHNILFIYLLKKEKVENGLIYKLIAFTKNFIHDVLAFIQPVQKEFIISLVIAFVCIVIGMLLIGLPGGAMINLLQKAGLLRGIKGDNVWPSAIHLSIVWPLCFPFSVLTKQFLFHRGHESFESLSLLLISGWIVFMIVITGLLFTNKS
ncbi:MAG: hypothetical protein K0R51_2007 [Cytophagaceae bacterium]|jgi:hypothetical protein|nr:hypothetical protein [Cytophagaceae bacterium]